MASKVQPIEHQPAIDRQRATPRLVRRRIVTAILLQIVHDAGLFNTRRKTGQDRLPLVTYRSRRYARDMDESTFFRSPELMSADDTGLLVVDVQEKVIREVAGHRRIIWNTRRLIDGARILGLPVLATEHYPKGLGPTVPELLTLLGTPFEKTAFSCCGSSGLCEKLRTLGRPKWLLCGIEAHVCIQQTAIDLMGEGFRVYVAADATGSRFQVDYDIALRRMDSSGVTLTTVEAALFEWCQDSKPPDFKKISALIKEKAEE